MPHRNDEMVLQILTNLSNKLDTLDSRLDSVDKTLVKQEANLGEHMRRTELAEKNISDIRDQIEPIKKHVAYVEGALRYLGVLAMIVTIIGGILKIFGVISPLNF